MIADDADEALQKFGREVQTLCELFRHAWHTLTDDALAAFNAQLTLVEALAQVAVLPIVRAPGDTP